MGKRWWVVLFILFFYILFISLKMVSASCAACNGGVCNGNCETGEDPGYCSDCATQPNCGDNVCNPPAETCSNCEKDCHLCNGASCNANGDCYSGQCCGAPSGVCVASIACSPGDSQVCSTNPPKAQSCTSSCAWGSCLSVPCVQNSDCTPTNPCLTSTCSGAPSYQCTASVPVPDGSTCGTPNKCEAGVCKAPCASPDFCGTSPANATLLDQYFCTGTPQCYACTAGHHLAGGLCVADTTCQNQCTSGETRCDPSGAQQVQTCGDWNSDGCTEWGNPQTCVGGTPFCGGGACVV
jgi:hypothetical protein